jgi:hypothetical protein
MSNAIIRATLESRLKAWADSQTPKIPIAFEGAPFTKPTTGAYLQPLLIPNITLNSDLSGKRNTLLGIFEVNCWIQSGRGMGGVEQIVNNIVNLFPVVPKTGNVSVENTPHAERPMVDDSGWIIVPVVIMYRYEN